ncbi:IclR family transcriptional regulator [Tomitella cavernea]|uniref:IclR family transcriptional regulator n=1 Tax=Tomitella cavernea TaxID=1387982 RepID=A0ABP9CYL7_9ACTN|nr:IclR family transcriptional regulator [Tomitella cavernea]
MGYRKDEAGSLSMLDRLDLILDVVEDAGFLTLSGVVERTGLARSTAHRLLTHLERKRWLFRVGSNYELGPRLFDLGTKGVRNHWFYRGALPALHRLHAQTGFVVHMAYLDGPEIVYWEKIGPGRFGAAVPTRIGGRNPAHATALGKALLAAQPRGMVDSLAPFAPATERTFCTPAALHQELDEVRRRGYAMDRSESLRGVGCYATAVQAGADDSVNAYRMTAAISVCVPVGRLDVRLVAPLLSAKKQIIDAARINPMTEPVDKD